MAPGEAEIGRQLQHQDSRDRSVDTLIITQIVPEFLGYLSSKSKQPK
jgi:hypothetical protein